MHYQSETALIRSLLGQGPSGFAAVIFTYVGVDFLLPQIHGTR